MFEKCASLALFLEYDHYFRRKIKFLISITNFLLAVFSYYRKHIGQFKGCGMPMRPDRAICFNPGGRADEIVIFARWPGICVPRDTGIVEPCIVEYRIGLSRWKDCKRSSLKIAKKCPKFRIVLESC